MITLFTCGDVVNYENADGKVCDEFLAEIISKADYSVCNFEAPITGFGSPQSKSGPHHSQRPETIEGLKEQGFDLLLLANNHMLDFGAEGLEKTIEAAKGSEMQTIGAGSDLKAAYSPLVKEIAGIKVGMINGCEAQFGVLDYYDRIQKAGYAWINHPLIDNKILKLRKECDFVVIFSHAGLEHYTIPQKEWRMRYRHFCDLGADIVVGSHPHVPQGYEKHGKSVIFYSLGNFYFDSKNYIEKEDSSFSPLFTLEKNQPPTFELIYHYKNAGKVRLAPIEKRVDVKNLCKQLESDIFTEAHDRMSLECYKKMFKNNLFFASTPPAYFKKQLRTALAKLLGRRRKTPNELLHLHLMRNEAYYYAARHALELLAEEEFTHHE